MTGSQNECEYDVAVAGAGAAGFLAAYSAARHGARTLLIDRRKKVGAKILISGGTRCNVTNQDVSERDFNSPSPPFVRNVLRQFPAGEARAFFEDHGVELQLEPSGKYFPRSGSARDVLAGLFRAIERAGVHLRRETLIASARTERDHFVVEADTGDIRARTLILCTGGLSYPQTGSDGIGYDIARSFKHTIVRTSPALTPLFTADPRYGRLCGVTLPVRLTLWVRGRKGVSLTGSFLFTHVGFSGPVALNISRHWLRNGWVPDSGVTVRVSFIPEATTEAFTGVWLDRQKQTPTRHVVNFLSDYVPYRLAEHIVLAAEAPPDLELGNTRKEVRMRILAELLEADLGVSGVAGYGKAEVTAGGVALDEVVAKTMQSRIQPGLFFAGEILDVDGYIGGFNFQWAWSSGWVAGREAARSCSSTRESNTGTSQRG